MISAYHAKYYAHELTRRHAADGVGRLSQSLFDASVDLNPHQIEAALFALRNPLQEGVLLTDEVGLGKTIEAALVLCQYWAERRRRLLVICPASLRKQWAQELHEKFAVPTTVVDAVALRKQAAGDTFTSLQALVGKAVVIMSYQFAAKLEAELRAVPWDVAVIDEAHKLRNAHRDSNRTGQALKRALAGRKKLLLTATPLQNSLMELYGLSTLIDEHLFGDEAAFRKQFLTGSAGMDELRERLAGFAKRTLRRDVLEYIKYTERKALTQPFEPTDAEQSLYERISTFLQREDSYALPKQQRHLTALILRKLLASSAHAVATTLVAIRERLERLLAGASEDDGTPLVEQLIADDELAQDYLEDATNEDDEASVADVPTQRDDDNPAAKRAAISAEIAELTAFINAAQTLQTDTKAQALLKALTLGFDKMAGLGAPRKAIVFTESRRTQEYLYRFLSANGYAGKLVMFAGTNTHEDSVAIYQRWLEEFKGTDRATGSPQVDRRTALIDHFRKNDGTGAEIMIATEAAAEGVNLQFCALIINYDLPWNPQRVEQRIGRCHRYGQRFDVVVINFLNTRNQADQRVLELLTEKFNLFNGVFGASDEVLGRVESSIDFEKRILKIYDTCRQPEQIEAAFNTLQAELEEVIAGRIKDTQTQLLENFDEDVHDRLKLRLADAQERLDKLGRWFWGVTQFALHDRARFDEAAYAFSLNHPPTGIAPGRYQLIRGGAQPDMLAHAYRLSGPLGEWSITASLDAPTPVATLKLDYGKHGARVSMVEKLRGKSGWLTLVRVEVTAFETTEALLFSGLTDDGEPLDQEACEKLLSIPAAGKPFTANNDVPDALAANSQRRVQATIADVLEVNQRLFNEERDKLERWADDKLLASEETLRNTKAALGAVEDSVRIMLGDIRDGSVIDYFAGSGTTGHAVISLNREDQGSRKYILIEQGGYFDSVIKARLQKVVFSSSWKDGKPTKPDTGISHCFKVIKLESYEDTLNNLQLRRSERQGELLSDLPQQAKDDYLLHYMLDVESRGSLLSVEDFRKPFGYTLNIAVDSAGASERRKIDLVETFNYLIGLRVKHIDAQPERGFAAVTGTLPNGDSCLVLWRDCELLNYEGLSKLCEKLAINPADNEYDVVYVNGDHNIPTVLTQTSEEGGTTKRLKLRQIEPEFLERMFSMEDA